jgi:hypothetical protein
MRFRECHSVSSPLFDGQAHPLPLLSSPSLSELWYSSHLPAYIASTGCRDARALIDCHVEYAAGVLGASAGLTHELLLPNSSICAWAKGPWFARSQCCNQDRGASTFCHSTHCLLQNRSSRIPRPPLRCVLCRPCNGCIIGRLSELTCMEWVQAPAHNLRAGIQLRACRLLGAKHIARLTLNTCHHAPQPLVVACASSWALLPCMGDQRARGTGGAMLVVLTETLLHCQKSVKLT